MVKGTVLSSITEFIVNKNGKEGLPQWLTALIGKAKRVFEGAIPVGNWYLFKEVVVVPIDQWSPPGIRKIYPDL